MVRPPTPDADITPPLPDKAVTTLAGGAEPGDADGPREVARFNNPVNLVAGQDGNLYVADFDNGRLRRVTTEGTVSTVDGPENGFARPFGLALAPDGAIYVQTDASAAGEPGPGALWVLRPDADELELAADDIGRARGLAVLSDGRVVLSNPAEHTLQIWDPETGEASPLAGSPGEAGYQDGTGAEAQFSMPYDVVVIDEDTLLVADRGNHRLRRVTLEGEVTTWAGSGEAGVDEGSREAASFHSPQALARDEQGTVYVTSTDGHVIQRVKDDEVTVFAGTGTPGHRDGDLLEAQFFGLEGIDLSQDGAYLYVADGTRGAEEPYHRVRRIALE